MKVGYFGKGSERVNQIQMKAGPSMDDESFEVSSPNDQGIVEDHIDKSFDTSEEPGQMLKE